MTAGLEGITVSRWVTTRLAADPDLADLAGDAEALADRITEGAYTGTAPWWITFTILEPVDVKVVGAIQVMSMVQVQVKVTGVGASYGTILPVYARVHLLLESQANQPVTDGLVLTSRRVSGVQFPERVNGIDYRSLGGRYETYAQ